MLFLGSLRCPRFGRGLRLKYMCQFSRNEPAFSEPFASHTPGYPSGVLEAPEVTIDDGEPESKKADSQLQSMSLQLIKLATTDGLTGLANRSGFQDEVRKGLSRTAAQGGRIALIKLNIDRFANVNDTFGVLAGDQLLVAVAHRLQVSCGGSAMLARLGADEFGIIVSFVSGYEEALEIARGLVKEVSQPLTICGRHIQLTVSSGVAIGPDDSASALELLRYSGIALHQAKVTIGNNICAFSTNMRDNIARRFELEYMIADGLVHDQFFAEFQPKVDLRTGEINGAEALCRWRHPQRGIIAPNVFIPVAEETGQIDELGRLVLSKTCQFAVALNNKSATAMPVAVNVSAHQFQRDEFLATLEHGLRSAGCEPAWLELEITESALMGDTPVLARTLEQIAALGITLSIDDFGTGYSSLSRLRRFPIDTVKIDQSFVRDLDTDTNQVVMVLAILAMAQGLGMKTVAEGVEDAATALQLLAMGCDSGQGYHFYRPMPADAVLELLA